MLIRLSNTPREYAWGSPSLIADLEGREASGAREAEVWFGDHPGSPSVVEDGSGRTLDELLAVSDGGPLRLPYLLKLLGAASHLSIQAHPSKAQAEAGFAREEAAGVPRDAPHRNYRDDNHKPELLVALSGRFEVLAGLRDLEATDRLFAVLGDAAAPVRARLAGTDAQAAVRDTIRWLLSGDAHGVVDAISTALADAESVEFAHELDVARRIAAVDPGDPGLVVAMLMNLVTLRPGEAVSVPAGVLHTYVSGLGVELMAASDNVLRGGLTPKHVDVAELLHVLDASTGPAPLLSPMPVADGIERFAPGIPDFALLRIAVSGNRSVVTSGIAVALATEGEVTVGGSTGDAAIMLRPGQALLATADESPLRVTGTGELFIAEPGAPGDRVAP